MYRDYGEKPDGSEYELVAWQVPVSEEFPEGLKYSFQYTSATGETLLRFDNAPHHPDIGRHHRHPPDGDIEPLEFTSLSDLIDDFRNEVDDIYEQRN
ncbi:toxin-antitoxin system TumE family protein [Halosimplex halobium]|uniref:toxin-antitoxin system TumE family protein n=1 Tax=Halosimplex halobium TaxID=3396618 RepID=UPI003F572490